MASVRDPLSAYRVWRDLAGPFGRFVLPSPFIRVEAKTHGGGSTVTLPKDRQSTQLVSAARRRALGLPMSTGVILDVPLHSGITLFRSEVTAAGDLTGSTRMLPRAVLIVGRVDAPGAILPTELLHGWPTEDDLEILGVGLANVPLDQHSDWWMQPLDEPVSQPTWFILDSERQRDISRTHLNRQLDNRYRYSVDHLPTADSLRGAGLTDAILVCQQSVPAPDLEPWLGSLLDHGFPVRVRACQ